MVVVLVLDQGVWVLVQSSMIPLQLLHRFCPTTSISALQSISNFSTLSLLALVNTQPHIDLDCTMIYTREENVLDCKHSAPNLDSRYDLIPTFETAKLTGPQV